MYFPRINANSIQNGQIQIIFHSVKILSQFSSQIGNIVLMCIKTMNNFCTSKPYSTIQIISTSISSDATVTRCFRPNFPQTKRISVIGSQKTEAQTYI